MAKTNWKMLLLVFDAEHKVGIVIPENGDGWECTALHGGFKINLMIIIMQSNMTDFIVLRAIKSLFMSLFLVNFRNFGIISLSSFQIA